MTRLAAKTPRSKTPPQAPRAGRAELSERAILRALEEDQIRIAQELHDTVCQSLSGLRLSVAALRRKSQDLEGQAAQECAHLEEVAAKSIGELHDIVRSLQPVEVSPADLPVALEEVARENRGPVECDFRMTGRPLVGDDFTASQVARIAGAAVKHARRTVGVRKIVIEWRDTARECILSVSSDQASFPEPAGAMEQAFGWSLLLRRAAAIGAVVTIERDGACLKLALPLATIPSEN